jgi:hypothetical protein
VPVEARSAAGELDTPAPAAGSPDPAVAAPVQQPPARAPGAEPAGLAQPAGAVTVEIETEPSGTRVVRERDGETIGKTPLRVSWPHGTGEEALRLERDGYRRERLAVPLDRGLKARLHLQALSRRAARRAPAAPAAPAAPPATTTARQPPRPRAPAAPSTPATAPKREPLKI